MNDTISYQLFFPVLPRALMYNQILPIGALTSWISETKSLPCAEKITSWLCDHNSLTQKLELQFNHFFVEVKQQVYIKPNNLLSPIFKNEEKILVREVFLHGENRPVVFAQTEIPFSTLTEQQVELAEIGEQPLGRILFQDPTMLRGQIEVTEFKKDSIFHQLATDLQQPADHSLWARRSLFYLNNRPLLVTELFLPASGIYDQ